MAAQHALSWCWTAVMVWRNEIGTCWTAAVLLGPIGKAHACSVAKSICGYALLQALHAQCTACHAGNQQEPVTSQHCISLSSCRSLSTCTHCTPSTSSDATGTASASAAIAAACTTQHGSAGLHWCGTAQFCIYHTNTSTAASGAHTAHACTLSVASCTLCCQTAH